MAGPPEVRAALADLGALQPEYEHPVMRVESFALARDLRETMRIRRLAPWG